MGVSDHAERAKVRCQAHLGNGGDVGLHYWDLLISCGAITLHSMAVVLGSRRLRLQPIPSPYDVHRARTRAVTTREPMACALCPVHSTLHMAFLSIGVNTPRRRERECVFGRCGGVDCPSFVPGLLLWRLASLVFSLLLPRRSPPCPPRGVTRREWGEVQRYENPPRGKYKYLVLIQYIRRGGGGITVEPTFR